MFVKSVMMIDKQYSPDQSYQSTAQRRQHTIDKQYSPGQSY